MYVASFVTSSESLPDQKAFEASSKFMCMRMSMMFMPDALEWSGAWYVFPTRVALVLIGWFAGPMRFSYWNCSAAATTSSSEYSLRSSQV
ncbi:hypothetical protein D3C74_349000 [compost metagenome]